MTATESRLFRRAAILSTGTEIMQGLYADTNARFLAEKLSAAGVEVIAISAAPDDADEMEITFKHLLSRADLVICSGGLGPTEDDVNRDVFARALDAPLEKDARAVEMMRERFTRRGREMPPSNEVQAMVPRGSQVLYNNWGTAPGFLLEQENGITVVALPGPPSELVPMFNEYVQPLLDRRCGNGVCVRTATIHTYGMPESTLNEAVRDLFRLDPEVTYTVLAKTYGVDVRITPRKTSRKETDAAVERFVRLTEDRIGSEWIYGRDDSTMQQAVAELLLSQGKTVTAAESCTGGMVAQLLTDIPGSSGYLMESYVTYSNEAKQRLLGVREETLASHGAVSEQVAAEMASGARKSTGADIAVAITGIAGPGGGSEQKPVGLTYIALASAEGVSVQRFQLIGDRQLNRLHAALHALNAIRLYLSK